MKLKKLGTLFLAFTMFMGVNTFASNRYLNMTITYDYHSYNYNKEEVFVSVDGKVLKDLSMPPIILKDYTLVPAREVFEAMGAKVEWKGDIEQVFISYNDILIVLSNNSKKAYVSGVAKEMDTEAKIINNKVMIPLRFVSTALGFDVSWDKATRTANISTKAVNGNEVTTPSAVDVTTVAQGGSSTEPSTETTTAAKQPEVIISEEPVNSVPSAEGKVIVIDAGHQQNQNKDLEPVGPGATQKKQKVSSGTQGVSTKTPEYVINLQIAQKLETELKNRGYSVTMVRTTNDVNISNAERAEVANNLKADAFLRVHCNGDSNSTTSGALTMCQQADNQYCGNLYKESHLLAQSVVDSLCTSTGAKNRGIIETNTMSGINWCKVPTTIIETGFLSNPEEDKLLNDSSYQDKVAKGIADGVDKYFASL